MNEPDDSMDHQFFQMVLSLQAGAMQQMGKIASPLNGKVDRDMEMAKLSIGMLEMMQKKTEGNLSADEKKLLDHVLYELRLNYVEELKKDASKGADADNKNSGVADTGTGAAPTDGPAEPAETDEDKAE